MKILITGGAGFIGSHLADALISKKHKVVIIDNLSTGFRKNLNPKAKFLKVDLRNHKKIENILKKEKPSVIFHLAAQMSVQESVKDPIFDAENNILASFNLIALSQKYKVNKIVFTSTGGAIYGDTRNRPTQETEKEWPLSPYGIAKLTVDRFLNYYSVMQGLNFVSLRFGNVYGPRQNPHGEAGVVAIFMKKMLRGDQPIINGNGKQTRDYVYVSDVVDANLLALKNINKTGVYNVGTGKETSVNKIFREINRHFGNAFKEVHGPAKPGEQKTSCLSNKKIRRAFGWIPKVDLENGIRRTFKWFKENK